MPHTNIGGAARAFRWKTFFLRFRRTRLTAELADWINGNGGTNGTLSFLSDEAFMFEGSFVRIPIFRRDGDVGAVSVDVTFVNGTAINGVDYVASNETLNWSDGDDRIKYVNVRALNLDENKTFNVQLSAPTGGSALDPLLDDMAVTIQLVPGSRGFLGFISQDQFTNPTTTFSATVYRFGGRRGAVSIDYATGGGTGTPGVDYTSTMGTFNWANGDSTSRTINVPILSPAADRTFEITLSDATGGAAPFAPTNPLDVTIYGTGASVNPGDIGFTVTQAQTPESVSLLVTVKRVNGSTGAVGVSYATTNGTAIAGTNYTNTSGMLAWADADSADKTFNIPILTVNQTSTFSVSLNTPTGGASIQTGQGTQNIIIYDTADPVVPVTDIIVDDMFYTAGESAEEIPFAYKTAEVHPLLWTVLDGGVAGWEGGVSNFSGSIELASVDESLIPSPPARFQMYQQLDGVLAE